MDLDCELDLDRFVAQKAYLAAQYADIYFSECDSVDAVFCHKNLSSDKSPRFACRSATGTVETKNLGRGQENLARCQGLRSYT